MDTESLNAIAQLIIQGMVSAIFIWAWAQERKERQEREKSHSEERETMTKELISLAREAYGLRAQSSVQSVHVNGNTAHVQDV